MPATLDRYGLTAFQIRQIAPKIGLDISKLTGSTDRDSILLVEYVTELPDAQREQATRLITEALRG